MRTPPPDARVYDSARLARSYASARPPLHQRILHAIRDRLPDPTTAARALDIGCGAGLSTAALGPCARTIVGLDPSRPMLSQAAAVAPRALLVVGSAERLPFRDGAFDLLAAAGSVNYADLDMFLHESARVLARQGTLVVYDFSGGRQLRGSSRLEEWSAEFERRYPSPPGYYLDPLQLPLEPHGLQQVAYQQFELSVAMSLESYVAYAMSETCIEVAISAGVPEAEIRAWCEESLADLFGDRTGEIVFSGYALCARVR